MAGLLSLAASCEELPSKGFIYRGALIGFHVMCGLLKLGEDSCRSSRHIRIYEEMMGASFKGSIAMKLLFEAPRALQPKALNHKTLEP